MLAYHDRYMIFKLSLLRYASYIYVIIFHDVHDIEIIFLIYQLYILYVDL